MNSVFRFVIWKVNEAAYVNEEHHKYSRDADVKNLFKAPLNIPVFASFII